VPERGAADQVREVLEAADRVRAQAEADAERTRGAVGRVGERADELRRRLDELSAAMTEAIAGLREELEALAAAEPEAAPPKAKPAKPAPAPAEPEPAPAPAEPEPAPAPAEPEPALEPAEEAAALAAEPAATPEAPAPEGARLLALKMALDGRSRDETAAYLRDNFELDDPEALLDEVYAQAGS
jgi:outer membrane biosynthesis protein TonB